MEVRLEALRYLATLKVADDAVQARVLGSLTALHERERLAAVRAVTAFRSDPKARTDCLLPLIDDVDPDVSLEVIKSLEPAIDDLRVKKALRSLFRHPSRRVKAAARSALGR
ncbi:MAG: HEAT repeat domain-containing protein [Planctomycetes bacterium]|nr:HEAT repeat domain-containing protein [Planctomycetota bacterium]